MSIYFLLKYTLSFLSDGDLFDDAMDGGQVNVNGRSEGSPELFDLSRLGESLAEPMSRTCSTPEAFLGPAAASLVNLDSLIPPNQAAKNFNPFLTGETEWDVSLHAKIEIRDVLSKLSQGTDEQVHELLNLLMLNHW